MLPAAKKSREKNDLIDIISIVTDFKLSRNTIINYWLAIWLNLNAQDRHMKYDMQEYEGYGPVQTIQGLVMTKEERPWKEIALRITGTP